MKNHLLLLILLSICLTGYSQKIPFNNYTLRSGLPADLILDITQDKKGYIWLATQNGVARFDGYDFRIFTMDDGLPDNYINCLFTGSKGCLWLGTQDGGISKYNGSEFLTYNVDSGLVSNSIQQIFEGPEKQIWILTHEGVSKLGKKRIINFTTATGLSDNYTMCSLVDSQGKIWIGTAHGLNLIDKNRIISVFDTSNGLSNNIIWDLIEDSNNRIWIATELGGLISYDDDRFDYYTINNGLTSNTILSLYEYPENIIWAGTYEAGISRINPKTNSVDYPLGIDKTCTIFGFTRDITDRLWLWTNNSGIYSLSGNRQDHYSKTNNLISDEIYKIYADKEGNVWFGGSGGLSKFGKGIFELYDSDYGLPGNTTICVMADEDNSVWGGTYNGLFRLNNNSSVDVFKRSDFDHVYDAVFSIYKDNSKKIWLGTFNTFTTYTGGEFSRIPASTCFGEASHQNAANSIIQDSMGNIWFAHENGICIYNENNFHMQNIDTGLPHQVVVAFESDHENRVWACTPNGTVIFSNKIITDTINMEKGLIDNTCNDIASDEYGNIWIATDRGLSKIVYAQDSLSSLTNYTTKSGLFSNTIMFVKASGDLLWIGHEKGIDRLRIPDNNIVNYGFADGFTPMETFRGAIDIDKEGNAWIGTVDGLVKYTKSADKKRENPPLTYITDVSLYNDTSNISRFASHTDPSTNLPANLTLPYTKNSLVFKYIGLHFTIPEKNRYMYFMDGYDETWIDAGNKRQAEYRNMPAGEYSFHVKAANCDDVWNKKAVSFSFTISPPFWQRTWFYIIEFILAAFIIVFIIKIRERKLQHDKRVLSKKVKERTLEIEKQKNKIEHQNSEIRDSILYAKRIQSAVLPDEREIKKSLPQHFILFKPRDIVSGDFYWIAKHNKRTVVVAADCTGHGVPGAFMSMLGISLLNEITGRKKELTACKILDLLREQIKTTLSQTGKHEEAKDGMDLALCIIDPERSVVQFAGAYNPLILIRNGEIIIYKGDKMPIGIHIGNETPFTNHIIEVKENDMIYMFSDGYADQFGGPEGKKFKSVPFKKLLLEISKKPLSRQKEILENTIEEWKGELEQVDDILVIGLRFPA